MRIIPWGVYFTWVSLVAGYGMEATPDYLLTLCLVNTYYTLGEYLFHRFTFHAPHRFPGITRLHAKHHQQPDHPNRLFIPIWITLFNDILLACLVHLCGGRVLSWLSAAHVSYLLFEYAHYGTHLPDTGRLLPARLTAFHHYHHVVDSVHYAFTTPYWDILFGTTRRSDSFTLQNYPLSWLPLSVVSFLSCNELHVLIRLIYLWPAYGAWKAGWGDACLVYLVTGIVFTVHHAHHGQYRLWKVADDTLAYLYVAVNGWLWWNTTNLSFWLVMSSCVASLVLFHMGRPITRHLLTGIGAGYMMSWAPSPVST